MSAPVRNTQPTPDAVVTEIEIGGMNCASCAGRVERALKAVPGVRDAAVNLATQRATLDIVKGTQQQRLEEAVRAAGYSVAPTEPTSGSSAANNRQSDELRHLKTSLLVAAVLTLPLFILEMGGHVSAQLHDWTMTQIGMDNSLLLQFILASLVLFGPGLRFFRIGVPHLLRLTPDMNSLVVLGTSAAWSYSVVATFSPSLLPDGTRHVYFEAAAVIITLILLGRYLEARAKGKTSQAIKRLIGLQPRIAHVKRGGDFVEAPIDAVVAGDILRIRPGERIAVDGRVLDGESYVDQSMMTGEPVPVRKTAGEQVIGGTINKTGSFTFEATHIGADTVLSQIIRMVEAAQGSKLPIQDLVDCVTRWFVPAVMAIAAVTFLVWLAFGPSPSLGFALVNAVAVLIIACPCAMGLATPISIMVATGKAAEMGILFRKGSALQGLRDVSVIAFDKTGTLTNGQPELTDFTPTKDRDRDKTLRLIASLETASEHPVADALVTAARKRDLVLSPASHFEAKPGFGISGRVDGHDILVGARHSMTASGIDVSVFEEQADALADAGKTPIFAGIDGQLAAMMAVADRLKDTTPAAIAALRAAGLKLVMISGDNIRTANAIARQAGIDDVVAEVLPDGKVAAVQRLREKGARVAFVGDGINDAPALTAADIGMAVGTGTDIAIESADVVLMSGDLNGIVRAIGISHAAIRNIHQNLFWAFGYNICLIPVAAGVLYPVYGLLLSPVLGAAAMGLSSVFVIANALRLRRFA